MTDFMDWLRGITPGSISSPQGTPGVVTDPSAPYSAAQPVAPDPIPPNLGPRAALPPAPDTSSLPPYQLGEPPTPTIDQRVATQPGGGAMAVAPFQVPGVGVGLPNVARMIEDIKSAPPQPAASAGVAPPVPAQGDNLPSLPPSQEIAANAPPAMAAPTPLAPAPDAGPAAPSDTPAGRSLLDRIMGSDDASTKDARGLTEADRHATGFSALAKLGFGIMAASMPQNPNQRAAAIAQLGSIPAGVLKEQAARIGMQAQAQRVQAGQVQLDKVKQTQEYMKTPEFKAAFDKMPPQMQAVAKAAGLSGDIGAIVHMQQSSMPKVAGNTVVDPVKGTITNTLTGMTTDMTGQPVMGPGGQQGPGTEAATAAPNPQTGFRDDWLQAQQRPAGYAARLKRIASGDEAFPAQRDPMRSQILQDLGTYAPDTPEQTYANKKKMQEAVTPGGKLYGTTILPAQRMINHGAALTDKIDALDKHGVSDGYIGTNGGNTVALWNLRKQGGESTKLVTEAEENLRTVKEEYAKFLRGTGNLTDQAQRRMDEVTLASGPSAVKGFLSWAMEAMHGQVDPLHKDYQRYMRNPRAGLDDMMGAGVEKNINKVGNWANGTKAAAAPAAAGPTPAQAAAELARRKATQAQ